MKSVVFGKEATERIELIVLGYEFPVTGDFYDDNWLSCEIRIRLGAFRGKFLANFLAGELTELHESLERLYRDLRGVAKFETMESQLELQFTCDSLGHIHVEGAATDQAGIGNKLSFSLSFDQTYLNQIVHDLDQVVRSFPVRT